MSNTVDAPVLVIGGSGLVGRATVRTLRRLHPTLPITIGGRNVQSAQTLAEEVGNATVTAVDIEKPDLGLPAISMFSAVVILTKDVGLNALKFAQKLSAPYISMSDYAPEIAPTVTHYIQKPTASPVLMLSSLLCGTIPVLVAGYAREFRSVESIQITALFDEKDPGGPSSRADGERSHVHLPSVLVLSQGLWQWVTGPKLQYTFTGVAEIELSARYIGFLDVMTLAAATEAKTVTLGYAAGLTASSRQGKGPSHEVTVEISGILANGREEHVRFEIVDPAGFSIMSGRGAAFGVERLLGLEGGSPVPPGLYHAEVLLEAAYIARRMQEMGTSIRRVSGGSGSTQ